MKRGDQIAYVPDHAVADNSYRGLEHPDIQFGFVCSISPYDSEKIFCRYWVKGHPGTLRTTANSVLTDITDLANYTSVEQEVVDKTIQEIQKADYEKI